MLNDSLLDMLATIFAYYTPALLSCYLFPLPPPSEFVLRPQEGFAWEIMHMGISCQKRILDVNFFNVFKNVDKLDAFTLSFFTNLDKVLIHIHFMNQKLYFESLSTFLKLYLMASRAITARTEAAMFNLQQSLKYN